MTINVQPRNTKLPHNTELRRLAASGMGRYEIAEQYGATLGRVTDRLRDLGIVAPLRGRARSVAPSEYRSIIVHRMGETITLPRVSIQQSQVQP